MAGLLIWNNREDWVHRPVTLRSAAGRRSAAADVIPPSVTLPPSVEVEHVEEVEPARGGMRAAQLPADILDFSLPTAPGAAHVVMIRHPSGAITFHTGDPDVQVRSARTRAAMMERFRIPAGRGVPQSERRSLIGKVFKIVVLKVVDLVADAVLPGLIRRWEEGRWKKRRQGWLRIDQQSLSTDTLASAKPQGDQRALLLLHGTFSETYGSFRDLCSTSFFADAQRIYGREIYGFDHFTISKTVEENARELLLGLPPSGRTFDVITYSRGGLVLRTILECASRLGADAQRLRVGNVVFVACPNEGTPLATPGRWRETVGWLATILDHVPDNPFTTAASFVGEAIVWIASHVTRSAPGLESMNKTGEIIEAIQASPSPPSGVYSALAVNHIPEPSLSQKLLDLGADAFFGGANDLVVPTEGGWRIDTGAAAPVIPADRIGCFGPGGNIAPTRQGVNHLHLFTNEEASDFLLRALQGQPQAIAPIDPDIRLPFGLRPQAVRGLNRAGSGPPPGNGLAGDAGGGAASPAPPPMTFDARGATPQVFSDTLSLTVLSGEDLASDPDAADKEKTAQLYAQYAGARVIVPFRTRGGEDGQRWRSIIGLCNSIRKFADGEVDAKEPDEAKMRELGCLLFDTLLPDGVRRLYDTARVREVGRGGRHLNVILTSQIPWVADIPWEFAFDHAQRSQLATEEVHFVRNALTEVPAERLEPRSGPLRVLVAVSQPSDAGTITAEEEKAVIMRGFQGLIDAGLAVVDTLDSVTTAGLHEKLLAGSEYDILHFIGHGEFDEERQTGRLIFEDGQGRQDSASVQDLRRLLRNRGIQLIFLNACQTGRGGSAKFARGLAWELVDIGIHCVVANQYAVLNSSATEFSQMFYWLLAQGETIGSAAREARIAVNYSMQRETIDWAVPVVYARNPESRLSIRNTPIIGIQPGGERRGLARKASATTLRLARTVAQKVITVAVCDIGGRYPKLAETLDRLNGAQKCFNFEVADVTAPIGVLQKVRGYETQFNADVAVRRLKSLPAELGVDYVYCLTRYPIMYETDGDQYLNFYNWWPDDPRTRVLIGSIPITATESAPVRSHRATANLLAQGLIGALADVGTHGGGKGHSKSCPLYTNTELNPNLVANRQRLDEVCRRKLMKAIPDELPALELILREFDEDGER